MLLTKLILVALLIIAVSALLYSHFNLAAITGALDMPTEDCLGLMKGNCETMASLPPAWFEPGMFITQLNRMVSCEELLDCGSCEECCPCWIEMGMECLSQDECP